MGTISGVLGALVLAKRLRLACKILIMTITEPTTMLTDYFMGTVALVFGISLWRLNSRGPWTRLFWPIGFFSGAVASILGGTFHGFAAHQSPALHAALWNITMFLIGASSSFMISAALSGPLERDGANTRWLWSGLWLSAAGLAIQIAGISLHERFNHNDLYHCVQSVAFYFFYKGARATPRAGSTLRAASTSGFMLD